MVAVLAVNVCCRDNKTLKTAKVGDAATLLVQLENWIEELLILKLKNVIQ